MALKIREELSVSGGKFAVLETLTRTVAAVCREDSTVRKLYIGIASGPDASSALKRRFDKYKKDQGINEMILLYESSSQAFCREVERYLETYFSDNHPDIINRTGGGAGRESSQPWHYVYLAVRRVRKYG
ncbi:MAG: hypothetical protein JNM33_06735 [Rubrivivax sp.]|nr:hypothetical protein [Rubrivivax sp.]